MDKSVNLATGSQARNVSPGKLLQPKHRNEPVAGLPGSSVLHSTRKGLTAGLDKRLINTPASSSFLKAHINSIQPKATCHPKSHIVFLKTHKTASSTILNVLYRYGESRNLTFALPLNKHSQLFYPFPFASHFVEGVMSRSVKEFHIMCNHMRFRKSEVSFIAKSFRLGCLTEFTAQFTRGLHMDTTRYKREDAKKKIQEKSLGFALLILCPCGSHIG